jgi:hypothetical protein
MQPCVRNNESACSRARHVHQTLNVANTPRDQVIRGAKSVVVVGQPSFVDDGTRRRKHYTSARKAEPLDQVGEPTPDTDPEPTLGGARRSRRNVRCTT